MKGLQICDELRWNSRWSSQLGERLDIRDSTSNLIVFDEKHTAKDIAKVLDGVPEELYRLFDLAEAPEEDCDYLLDSGRCYRRLH